MQFTFIQKSLVMAAMLLPYAQAGAQSVRSGQAATENSAEHEIHAALCDIDKRDYASAEKKLERLLQSDPKNIYAQKLLPSTLAAQIKIGQESADNATVARKAIEAYQRVSNNPKISGEERVQIDRYVLILYRHIGADEQRKEIQKRALDSTRSPRDRSVLYAILASQSWDCAYRITSKEAGPEKAEIEKAAGCVSKGLDIANQAITLDRENESAWSYKASLLKEAAKLAGFAHNRTQQASYQRQADDALKHTFDLSAKRRAEEDRNWARQNEERERNDSFTTKDAEKAAKELVSFEAETSLEDAVKRVFVPSQLELTTLVVPVPIPQQKTEPTETTASSTASPPPQKGCFREADRTTSIQERRDWKSFSVDEELVVDLPDNVCARGSGYVAASEGVMYDIDSIPRPAIASEPAVLDGALNTLTRVFVGLRSGIWLDGGLANSFELRLLRKDDVNGQPRKVYAYARISCAERMESVLIVQAGRTHYYTIDISGANESDARVQRFLKSVKLK
jgi:tetratricopeptide (TPR) repeat protein